MNASSDMEAKSLSHIAKRKLIRSLITHNISGPAGQSLQPYCKTKACARSSVIEHLLLGHVARETDFALRADLKREPVPSPIDFTILLLVTHKTYIDPAPVAF